MKVRGGVGGSIEVALFQLYGEVKVSVGVGGNRGNRGGTNSAIGGNWG